MDENRLSDIEVRVVGSLMEKEMTTPDLLRGPQTLGEIKGRGQRLFDFATLEDVDATIDALARRTIPLADRVPRAPGQKEGRVAAMVGPPPPIASQPDSDPQPAQETPRRASATATDERLAAVETAVAQLHDEIAELRARLEEFRRQFE